MSVIIYRDVSIDIRFHIKSFGGGFSGNILLADIILTKRLDSYSSILLLLFILNPHSFKKVCLEIPDAHRAPDLFSSWFYLFCFYGTFRTIWAVNHTNVVCSAYGPVPPHSINK